MTRCNEELNSSDPLKQQLAHKIIQAEEGAAKDGTTLQGREMRFIVRRQYSIRKQLGQIWSVLDLKDVKLSYSEDDKNLEAWYRRWKKVYNSLEPKPIGDILDSVCEMLVRCIWHGSEVMKVVIQHWD